MSKLKGQSRARHRLGPRHRPRHRAEARAARAPSVVVNDLDAEPGEAVAAEIKAAGRRGGRRHRQRHRRRTSPIASSSAALDTFGGLDIIVNNAGYTWDNVIQKMTDEQFQAMLDVHLMAPFRILRAAAEPIRDHGEEGSRRPAARCSARS